jgi:hypothetical protein
VLVTETVGAISEEISDSYKVLNLICRLWINWQAYDPGLLIRLGELVIITDPMVSA